MQGLAIFKQHQRLAYEAVVQVRKELQVGMTEIEAAHLLTQFFQTRGITKFFHHPFAWFGDRSAFHGFKRPELPSLKSPIPHLGLEFMPTNRQLEMGMAVILDVAPAVENLAVDIGYSFCFGENPQHLAMRKDLLLLRSRILELVKNKVSLKTVYTEIEQELTSKGYRNCHALYPLGVLGHRIGELPKLPLPRLKVLGFDLEAYGYLLKERIKGAAIITADDDRSFSPGLWAIEPHIAQGDMGVKFEEILVVTANDAYWLDEELPHVSEL